MTVRRSMTGTIRIGGRVRSFKELRRFIRQRYAEANTAFRSHLAGSRGEFASHSCPSCAEFQGRLSELSDLYDVAGGRKKLGH